MVIYKTTNLVNGKIYIGKDSKNNPKYLGSGKLLKRSIQKYGILNFNKEILEYCDSDDILNEKEIYWIDKYKSYDTKIGYNIALGGNGGDTISNHPNKKEIYDKLKPIAKKNALDYWANLSDDDRKHRSEIMSGENNPMYGKEGYWKDKTMPSDITERQVKTRNEKYNNYLGESNPNYNNRWSDVQKEIQSHLMKSKFDNGEIIKYKDGRTHIELFGEEKAKEISKKLSKIASARIGDKNTFYGKKHTTETKEKIRQANTGRKPPNVRKIIIDDNEYESLSDANRKLDIKVPTIWHRLKSENYPNYNYK